MKKEIIKTETATADFAYIGDERIYIYCRMEIYRQGSPEGAGKAGNPEGNVSKTLARPSSPWQRVFERARTLPKENPFAQGQDETGATWKLWKETQGLCPFSEANLASYGHILLGEPAREGFMKEEEAGRHYVAIPGRFMGREQPMAGQRVFTLWQPMSGAEKTFDDIMTASREEIEYIYGYWIARVDIGTGEFSEA